MSREVSVCNWKVAGGSENSIGAIGKKPFSLARLATACSQVPSLHQLVSRGAVCGSLWPCAPAHGAAALAATGGGFALAQDDGSMVRSFGQLSLLPSHGAPSRLQLEGALLASRRPREVADKPALEDTESLDVLKFLKKCKKDKFREKEAIQVGSAALQPFVAEWLGTRTAGTLDDSNFTLTIYCYPAKRKKRALRPDPEANSRRPPRFLIHPDAPPLRGDAELALLRRWGATFRVIWALEEAAAVDHHLKVRLHPLLHVAPNLGGRPQVLAALARLRNLQPVAAVDSRKAVNTAIRLVEKADTVAKFRKMLRLDLNRAAVLTVVDLCTISLPPDPHLESSDAGGTPFNEETKVGHEPED